MDKQQKEVYNWAQKEAGQSWTKEQINELINVVEVNSHLREQNAALTKNVTYFRTMYNTKNHENKKLRRNNLILQFAIIVLIIALGVMYVIVT